MSEVAALLSAQQSLRQCFDVIEQQQEEWKHVLMECEPLISTLSNLAEQLQACQKVTFTQTPLGGFTDLQDRLRYKLEAAVDLTLEKLNDNMCTLQKVRDSVSQKVGSTLYVYEVNAEVLSLEASLQRTSLSPSIADMLEWLQDIEKYYRNQYLQRRLLLQLHNDCLTEMKSLPHSWAKLEDNSSSKQQFVQDTLLNVSFFREAA
ncbi:AFG2-interacting ribosome maturation factor [Pseudophryne corroboree]|uniref:AFG2-interacting ribosome maturation factor n=1 Tax=Pseudophryne corroboree TaxID=495146 RepID=UPI0030819E4F